MAPPRFPKVKTRKVLSRIYERKIETSARRKSVMSSLRSHRLLQNESVQRCSNDTVEPSMLTATCTKFYTESPGGLHRAFFVGSVVNDSEGS